ncbi:MAG: hypothetical protein DLM61_02630 [Pseudonocardiales bacterium]|nr:MAG: hypothetical protein DLM61_02630 [Pseudonocardiales bacterium]
MTRVVAVATATLWTAPDAPRPQDDAALAAPSDVRGWTVLMSDADRLDLHGRVVSQALLGDEVVVDEERDGWSRVALPGQPSSQDPRGYPGWLPTAQLADWDPPDAAAVAMVGRSTTALHATPGGPPTIHDVSFATRLPVAGSPEGGWLPVRTPGGAAWVPAADVDIDLGHHALPAAAELLTTAGQFTGLPYLWGGTSGLGLDCSGLVHVLFRRYGVTVPRDAHDQAAAGPSDVEPAQAAPGDLLFFARPGQEIHHVGICAGAGRMLHAPETGRAVALEPLSPRRREPLVTARRW